MPSRAEGFAWLAGRLAWEERLRHLEAPAAVERKRAVKAPNPRPALARAS